MKKRNFIAFLLVVIISFLSALPAGALSIADYVEPDDYIIELRGVESFVEAEVLSLEKNQLSNGGYVEYEELRLHDIKFKIGETIHGKEISVETLTLTTYGYGLAVGDKLIIGLTKLDDKTRKEITHWNEGVDPGDYRLNCKFRKRDDGSVEAIMLGSNLVYNSFEDIVLKIEGKLDTVYDRGYYYGQGDSLFYHGLRVYYATATKGENIYAKRSLKSSKFVVLQPWDRVLKIGETDVIGKERWEKILLAGGKIGYMPEGALRISNKFPEGLQSAKLATVTKTTKLKDRYRNSIAYASVRKGTATVVMENLYYTPETEKVKYETLRAGPDELSLVPSGNVARWPDAVNANLSIQGVDIYEEEKPEEVGNAFPGLALGTYYIRSVAKSAKIYATPNEKSDVLLSVGKGDRLIQIGTALAKNGKSWAKIVLANADGYIADDKLESKFKIEVKANDYLASMAVAIGTSSYTYALKDGMLVLDKNVILRKGSKVFVDGFYITIDEQRFYRVNAADGERYVQGNKFAF